MASERDGQPSTGGLLKCGGQEQREQVTCSAKLARIATLGVHKSSRKRQQLPWAAASHCSASGCAQMHANETHQQQQQVGAASPPFSSGIGMWNWPAAFIVGRALSPLSSHI